MENIVGAEHKMVKIQLELPEDVNIELGVYSLRNDLNDKRKSIIKILQEKLLKKGSLQVKEDE